MTRKLDKTQIARLARIVEPAPATHPAAMRTFELPTALYVATGGAYFGFVAILATALSTRGLIVPMGIIAAFLTAFLAVPALFVRMNPDLAERALSWAEFRKRGIQTCTGRMSAGDATIQVLILPALILCWGLTVAVIAALV